MSTLESKSLRETGKTLATLHVAVLMGGASGEREVSLVTGASVLAALQGSVRDGALGSVQTVEIDARGRWIVEGEARDAARALQLLREVDVFFLGLHGGAGEDGTLQGLLASAGRRHTGSPVGASAICMDKWATRGLAQSIGLRVAPGCVIGAQDFASDRDGELERVRRADLAAQAWVVKPRRGGSSVNTHLVRESHELAAAIASVLERGDDALVETRIAGVEVSCGVLDFGRAGTRSLPPIEIQPQAEHFFDYEQKYSESGAFEVCPAVSISASEEARVREASLQLHRICGCAGYSRSDFIVPASGDVVLLEINTLPGLTPRSLLPKEALHVGIGYAELCLGLIESAWNGGAK